MSALFESIEPRQMLSATPVLTGAQQANFEKLFTDLAAIHAKSEVTKDQVVKLTADVKAVLAVAVRPSATTIVKLRTDTRAAVADKVITPAEKATLAYDVQNVLISAHVPATLAKAVAADVKSIYSSTNITQDDIRLVVSDITAIITTFQINHPR